MSAYRGIGALLAGFVALLLVLAPQVVSGQSHAARPLFLAIPQTFPDLDARAVIMREPGRDIVVLRDDGADPETLQVALHVLDRVDRDHPRPVDRGQLVPITGFVYRRDLGPERRAALASALDELGERPLANVGNLGLGRWLQYRAP